MPGRLTGKVALITGGTRGIGAEIVRAFLAEGANVAFSGTRRVDNVRHAGNEALSFAAEFSEPDAPIRLVEDVIRHFGGIDVVVNNAGVISRTNEWDMSVEEWDRIHAINLRAVFFTARECAKSMRSRGGGSIINVSSIAGQSGGIAASPDYASTKGGVLALTRSLARRLAAHKIRVNALSPANIETDMTASWDSTVRSQLLNITPLKRFGRLDEIAGAALFLASDESTYVTGQTLSVNGGSFMN
jgi:3-oxoacyl-[acyl-carrier protein] reductase